MQQLSSKGLVITRKRKKWKFAHFDSWENCFALARGEDPQNVAEKIQHYFAPRTDPGAEGRRLVLELAAGNAQFSLELARRYPQVNFIAIDVKSDRLYTSAKKSFARKRIKHCFSSPSSSAYVAAYRNWCRIK